MKKLLNSSELTAISGGFAKSRVGHNWPPNVVTGFGKPIPPPREKTFLESLAEQLKWVDEWLGIKP